MQLYCSDFKIAKTTHIAHPYPCGTANRWIATHPAQRALSASYYYAIANAKDEVIGSVSVLFYKEHSRAEIGYWVGVPFWGKGICTQAVCAIIRAVFMHTDVNKICAMYLSNNPASGRVLQKAGMHQEGHFAQHVVQYAEVLDQIYCAILRGKWEETHVDSQ